MRQSHKTLLLWGILILMFVVIFKSVTAVDAQAEEVNFSAFLTKVKAGELTNEEVEIRNNTQFFWTNEHTKQHSVGVLTDNVLTLLDKHNVAFKLVQEDDIGMATLLLSWLPMLLVFFFLFFLMRQLQAGGSKAMSFGKSRAKQLTDSGEKVLFSDIAGINEAKAELEEVVDFLKDPKKFSRLGGKIPKGVLLMGPPGTGKTMLAKGVAGEAEVPFFSISGSDFVEMFVGVGASRVRDLFEQSKKQAPCIVFIDEIDAVGRQRGAGLGGGHDEREQTLNQLLVEMDGFEASEGVILIAATNRADVLDPALLRPGRFDRRVVVDLPDLNGRHEILKVHSKKIPLSGDLDLATIARGTPGFSGADLANLVNESALVAARNDKNTVGSEDFEYSRDKVLMGAARRSMVMSEKELRNTAYHETGHAIIAAKLEHTDPLHKVTIIPRGRALGLTQTLPTEDRHSISKSYALDQICMLYGGRIAEVMTFDELSTGAGNDIEKATSLARKMVTEWGMGDKAGPIAYGQPQGEIFLGRQIANKQEFSSATAASLDAEISSILREQYSRAEELLNKHQKYLVIVSEKLLEYETLEGAEVMALLKGEPLTRVPPVERLQTREGLEKKMAAEASAKEKAEKDAEKTKGDTDTDTTSPGDTLLGTLAGSEA